jgi:hypothetical protein
MTEKREGSASKSGVRGRPGKLRLKKETLKDLDAARGKGVKGGGLILATTACRGGQTLKCDGGTGTIGCGANSLAPGCAGGFLSLGCQ